MLLNSFPGRFVPANVIVPPVALVNVTVRDPAFQEADVEAFVQVPVTVQVDEPMTTYAFTAPTFTLPLTVIEDPFATKVPRVARVSAPAVMPKFEAELARTVDPAAPPVELRIVSVPPNRSAFVAIV